MIYNTTCFFLDIWSKNEKWKVMDNHILRQPYVILATSNSPLYRTMVEGPLLGFETSEATSRVSIVVLNDTTLYNTTPH